MFAIDLPDVVAKAPAVDGITYTAADVTDADQVQSAVDQASGSGVPLRIVVNCAGIGPSARVVGRSGVHDLDLFRKVIDVNLVGTFNVLRLAAEAIGKTEADEQGQRGVVVNTASVAAFEGQIEATAYAASRDVASLTLPAARDLASRGIRVMTIAPGIVDTPMLATVSEEYHKGLAEGAVPEAARRSGGLRAAGDQHHRARLPQRRSDPNGRCAAHGAGDRAQRAAGSTGSPGHSSLACGICSTASKSSTAARSGSAHVVLVVLQQRSRCDSTGGHR